MPAFSRYIGVIRDRVDQIFEDVNSNPQMDIIKQLMALPWDWANQEIIESWELVAARAHQEAMTKALKATRKADEVADETARQSASYAKLHALDLAEVTTLGSKDGLTQIILTSVRSNESSLELAKKVRNQVGLTKRSVIAYAARKAKLEAQGFSDEAIRRNLFTWVNRTLKRRAETIARTEVNLARNQGTLQVWRTQIALGELPRDGKKVWIANPGCRVCTEIEAQGPVPVNGSWRHPLTGFAIGSPPAHPNCRCSPALTFE